MDELESILVHYRVATAHEVRSWSFGELHRARQTGLESGQALRGTLDDQAIFGPLRDFCCDCGKYEGIKYKGMICDRCGVKIASSEIRRTRFAHIEFPAPIRHPLFGPQDLIHVFPVLPAAYHDEPLRQLYEQLLAAKGPGSAGEIAGTVERIQAKLIPDFVRAVSRERPDAAVMARGLCAVHCSEPEDEERCNECGYPLAGLDVVRCPNCHRRPAGR